MSTLGQFSDDADTAAASPRYHPFEEFDTIDSAEVEDAGERRRLVVAAVEAKGRLPKVDEIETVAELVDLIREVSLATADGRVLQPPAEDVTGEIRRLHRQLHPRAQRYYLGDSEVLDAVNSAREAFNKWLAAVRDEHEIPTAQEVGEERHDTAAARDASQAVQALADLVDRRLRELRETARDARRRALEQASAEVVENTPATPANAEDERGGGV